MGLILTNYGVQLDKDSYNEAKNLAIEMLISNHNYEYTFWLENSVQSILNQQINLLEEIGLKNIIKKGEKNVNNGCKV